MYGNKLPVRSTGFDQVFQGQVVKNNDEHLEISGDLLASGGNLSCVIYFPQFSTHAIHRATHLTV